MRQFIIPLSGAAIILFVYFFKSASPHEKPVTEIIPTRVIPQQQMQQAPLQKIDLAVQTDSKLPSTEADSISELESKHKSAARERGLNDSILTIDELRERYAVADLREALKVAKPITANLELPIRPVLAARFKSPKGEIFHYRQNGNNGGGCAAIKFRDRPPIVANLEDKSLQEWELPDRYAAIVSLRDNYYLLILTELSEERRNRNESQNYLHYLYRKNTDGSVRLLATYDGSEPHRGDLFKMSLDEFCQDSFLEE